MLPPREQVIELLKANFPFKKMEEPQMDVLISQLEEIDYEDGNMIYQQGAFADKLYLIFSGQVQVTRIRGNKVEKIAKLDSGHIFGLDMLSSVQRRNTQATAVGSVRLFWLDRDKLRGLIREFPGLKDDFSVLHDSFHLSLRTPLNWRDPDEAVIYVAQRHVYFLWQRFFSVFLIGLFTLPVVIYILGISPPDLLVPKLLLGLDLAVIIGLGVWNYYDWSNDYSIITSKRVVFQEKVVFLYDSRDEAPLSAILSINTDTGQFARMIGYGDVQVRTYAGLIVLSKVKNPQIVERLLRDQWSHAEQNQVNEEMQAAMGTIRTRLGLDEEGTAGAKPGKAGSAKAGSFSLSVSRWLANMFQMRFEKNGIITYRTHWFILIKRIWGPTFILFILLGLLITSLFGGLKPISLAAVFIFDIVVGVVVLGWWAYQYADWRNDYYQITSDQVIDVYKKPLGKEERRAAPFKNVQSIEYERIGLPALILNYGTVILRVGEARLTFDDVYDPSEVQRELFKRMAEREYRERLAQSKSERERFAAWLEAYHRVVNPNDDTAENPPFPEQFSG